MKLIIAGATGYVGTELLRQSLAHPAITTVIALARREVSLPSSSSSLPATTTTTQKFKSVVCDDFENYSDSVKAELAGADACIWTIAITPAKTRTMPWDQVVKICRDYTDYGLDTMANLPRPSGSTGLPLRFLYISGSNAERDQSKKPWLLGDVCLMRGDIESRVLSYTRKSPTKIQACIAKPGLINSPEKRGVVLNSVMGALKSISPLPVIDLREFSAALLSWAVEGKVDGEEGKDTLLNADLERIGREELEKRRRASAAAGEVEGEGEGGEKE